MIHLTPFSDQQAGLDENTLAAELRSSGEYVQIPDYAYDCHTREGKRRKLIFSKLSKPHLNRSSRGCLIILLTSDPNMRR